jgi:hypothetical protein
MRSQQQRQNIIDNFSAPVCVENFLNAEDIATLIDIFEGSSGKIHKNTGPITLNITEDQWTTPIFMKIKKQLHDQIGDFDVIAGFFFYTDWPHVIHNDDSFNFPCTYKALAMPILIDYKEGHQGNLDHPFLCLFEQYYLDGPSKFYNGGSNKPVYYNVPVYEYSKVYNTVSDEFPEELYERYLSHLNPQWLKGLSFDRSFDWIPGNGLIFDSVMLHAASNFKSQGIKAKLGMSIFTCKKKDN